MDGDKKLKIKDKIKMKILITGVHGFVGGNLVKALSKEHTIYGLDIIAPVKDGVKYTFSWDYLDKEDVIPEIDAIIHLPQPLQC